MILSETGARDQIPELVDGLPNLSGSEDVVARAMARPGPIYLPESDIDFRKARSAFAIALHMHQPLIPAGGHDLRTARIISNLKDMMDHPGTGDNHNATVFHWCYKRMGEFIPQLVREGKSPRVMLEYSGTLLYGLRAMGLDDVLEALKRITQDPALRRLGRVAGHAVGPPGGAVDADAGLPPARAGLAAPLRGALRPGGPGPGARLLAVGDGPAEPPGRGVRVRQDPEGLRLPVGPGAGAHGRAGRGRAGHPLPARAAPAGRPELAGRDGRHHRHRQDPGQRHETHRPDAAVLRGQEPDPSPAGRARRSRRWSCRSPTARTAAS